MLPKIDVPLYEITLPLLKKKVKFRPFLVKEEKILLMAMESQDEDAILLGIKQIINNCLVGKIKVDDLPLLDFEYLFLNLRARSVGEMVELQYKCNNEVQKGEETGKCNNLVNLSFNVLEIKPDASLPSNKIQLTENLGICLKYPTFNGIEKLSVKDTGISEVVGKTVINSIDYIYDKDEIFYAKDTPEQELLEFIDSLTREQFVKIQEFLEKLPKLKKELDFKCKKCGHEETLVLEGIQSFFV